MKDNYKQRFKEWLYKRLNVFSQTNLKRRAYLECLFNHSDKIDLTTLGSFFNWICDTKHDLVALLMWGSYTHGLENKYSFNRLKINEIRQPLMICGPSDIDALLVTRKVISKPKLLKNYAILDRNFKLVDTVNLDIFRDVFLIHEDELETFLNVQSERYVDLYTYSFFHNGLLLKSNYKIYEIFQQLKEERNYYKNARKYFNDKRDWFSHFTVM